MPNAAKSSQEIPNRPNAKEECDPPKIISKTRNSEDKTSSRRERLAEMVTLDIMYPIFIFVRANGATLYR